MSETHRRIVFSFGRIRVVGIFYDFAQPAFIIETQTGVDAMGAQMWLQNCKVRHEATLHEPALTPSEMVLYRVLTTYYMSDMEKEQTNAGS